MAERFESARNHQQKAPQFVRVGALFFKLKAVEGLSNSKAIFFLRRNARIPIQARRPTFFLASAILRNHLPTTADPVECRNLLQAAS